MSTIPNPRVLCNSTQPQTAQYGVHCIVKEEIPGLTVITMAAFMSLVAVSIIFVLIARNVIRERRRHFKFRRSLFSEPIEVYMVSLFSADLLQALGGSMELKWINDGFVQVGPVCTAQGFLQNIGQSGIAITTLIITLHTFVTLWWSDIDRLKPIRDSLKVAWFLVGITWLYLILSLVISVAILKNPPFYSPTPFWCWITTYHPKLRIAFQNFWLWIAFAVSVLYIPLIWWAQGYVTPSTETWWKFDVHAQIDMRLSGASWLMLICALAYVIPVLPTGLSRLFQTIQGSDAPFGTMKAQFVVNGIFMLSGLIDILVFALAREGLLLFGPPPLDSDGQTDREDKRKSGRLPSLPTSVQNRGTLPGNITGTFGQETNSHSPGPSPTRDQPVPTSDPEIQDSGLRRSTSEIDETRREGSTQQHSGQRNSVVQHSSEQQDTGVMHGESPPSSESSVQKATYPPSQGTEPSSESTPLFSRNWAIVLFVAWVCTNIAYGFWVKYYMHTATYPNPHSKINKLNQNWIGFFVMMYLIGFCIGAINLFGFLFLFNRTYTWFHKEDSSNTEGPSFFPTLQNTLHILIALFLVISLMFGPLLGPALAFRKVQRHAWNHKCDSFTTEIILDGRQFNEPANTPLQASFYYWQEGVRTKLYWYNMTFDSSNSNISYLQFGGFEQGVTATTSALYYPLIENMTLELSNKTFSADCVTSAEGQTNTIRSCFTGSYMNIISGNFNITTHDTVKNVTSQYRAIDDNWAYANAADAPNYILRDVVTFPNGDAVVETAVTQPGHCSSLKLCTSKPGDGGVLAVAGLTLIQQGRYSVYCTTPNSS